MNTCYSVSFHLLSIGQARYTVVRVLFLELVCLLGSRFFFDIRLALVGALMAWFR